MSLVQKRYAIDLRCAGSQTLEAAGAGQSLNIAAAVHAEVEEAKRDRSARPTDDPQRMSTRALLERILGRDHSHIRRVLPAIAPLAIKVARVDGIREPKLPLLAAAVQELVDTLGPHLDEEEEVLFPALADGWDAKFDIQQAIDEHRALAQMLDRMYEASDHFQAPPWASAPYRVLSRELRALDADLREHIRLENHVLFPRFSAPLAVEQVRDQNGREGTGAVPKA